MKVLDNHFRFEFPLKGIRRVDSGSFSCCLLSGPYRGKKGKEVETVKIFAKMIHGIIHRKAKRNIRNMGGTHKIRRKTRPAPKSLFIH